MNRVNIEELNVMLSGQKPNKIPNGDWVAVDGGFNYLITNNIEPIAIYGDFDSLTDKPEKYNYIKKESQDLTDSEFALLTIHKNFPKIKRLNIYGATGNRLDHFFANILLLRNSILRDANVDISIIDDNNFIYIGKKGTNDIEYKKEYRYISFVPLEDKTKITLINAKYSVEDYLLTIDRANAISNEFLNDSNIILEANKECLIIYSKD